MVRAITVLIVDDDSEQREYIAAKFLEEHPCRILNAESAAHALELVKKYDVDVVITDFLMPGGIGTGVELMQAILKLDRPQPLMILMTGFGDALPVNAFNHSVAAVFYKPFRIEELVNATFQRLQTAA